jgi:cytochrome c oxidase assembly protein subunit 20
LAKYLSQATNAMADKEITEVPQQSKSSGEDQKRYIAPPVVTDSIANTYSDRTVPSIADGFKTIRWNDFKTVHQQPCVRDSYLLGMRVGFGIGGLRFVLGG